MSLAWLLHVQSSWIGPSSEQGHFSEYLLLWQPRAAPGDLEWFGRFGWYRILMDSVYILLRRLLSRFEVWQCYTVFQICGGHAMGMQCQLPRECTVSISSPTDVTRGLNPLPWACCCSKLRMPLGLAMSCSLTQFGSVLNRFDSIFIRSRVKQSWHLMAIAGPKPCLESPSDPSESIRFISSLFDLRGLATPCHHFPERLMVEAPRRQESSTATMILEYFECRAMPSPCFLTSLNHVVTGTVTISSYFIYGLLLNGQCWVASGFRYAPDLPTAQCHFATCLWRIIVGLIFVIGGGEMWWMMVNVLQLSMSSQGLLSLWNLVKWYDGLWQRWNGDIVLVPKGHE